MFKSAMLNADINYLINTGTYTGIIEYLSILWRYWILVYCKVNLEIKIVHYLQIIYFISFDPFKYVKQEILKLAVRVHKIVLWNNPTVCNNVALNPFPVLKNLLYLIIQ